MAQTDSDPKKNPVLEYKVQRLESKAKMLAARLQHAEQRIALRASHIAMAEALRYTELPASDVVRFAAYLSDRLGLDCPSADLVCDLQDGIVDVDAIRGKLKRSPIVIATTLNNVARRLDFVSRLSSASLKVAFSGSARGEADNAKKQTLTALLHSGSFDVADAPPAGFSVVAFVCTYNEGDIIGPLLQHLIDQGVEPYLIDNRSTDDTVTQAERFLERGLRGIESFPAEGPADTFALQQMLRRIQVLSQEINADWFMINDADEFRYAPDSSLRLRDAFYRADASGFNAIDLTILHFHPVDNEFVPGQSPERFLRYFEFPLAGPYYCQRKAWKNTGVPVEIAASGSHDISFSGRRIYPYKFLSKHYPIRSQQHGERKIFAERVGRFSPYEKRELAWHTQYDAFSRSDSFLRKPRDLIRFDESFDREYLIERLSGIGAQRHETIDAPRPSAR